MTAQDANNKANGVQFVKKAAWEVTKKIQKEADRGGYGYIYDLYPFTFKKIPKNLNSLLDYDRKELKQKFAKYFEDLGYKTKIRDNEILISWTDV